VDFSSCFTSVGQDQLDFSLVFLLGTFLLVFLTGFNLPTVFFVGVSLVVFVVLDAVGAGV
jgi:hypothetical protein